MSKSCLFIVGIILSGWCFVGVSIAQEGFDPYITATDVNQIHAAKMLVEYFESATEPASFTIRQGKEFEQHQAVIRKEILRSLALDPLPERVALDIHESSALDHPWCTVCRVYYQIWPGIYSNGLLYIPKIFKEKPAPAILSLTGHWPNESAYAEEQKRCLYFAKLGYVVFAAPQNHYEDLPIGISHQTHMVWSNMRALDYLQSLDSVDANRIGCCGGSGGGLQTQMLLALDNRVRAATIVGMTCDYRENLFPHVASCGCLHFPGIIKIANQPEISALGMPTPVQYLTMNDYTRNFERDSFGAIKQLYAKNGFADRVECRYWPTEHSYDKPKRDVTYRWMEKWLRNKVSGETEVEPNIVSLPVPTVLELSAHLPDSARSLEQLSEIFARQRKYKIEGISDNNGWVAYRNRKISVLKQILGEPQPVNLKPSDVNITEIGSEGDIQIEHLTCAVEGTFKVSAILMKPSSGTKLKPVIICSGNGKRQMQKESGPGSPIEMAKQGSMVILPDLRFTGEIDLDNLIGVGPTSLMQFKPAYSQDAWLCSQDYSFHYHIMRAWQRNTITWGRPFVGMGVTDIERLVDYLASRPDTDMKKMTIIGKASQKDPNSTIPLAVLFAAAIDERLKIVDIDLGKHSFEERSLSPVPFILWHGDVLQWAACIADRELTIRNVSQKAGDRLWLVNVFDVMNNRTQLRFEN